jgi:lysophospholipase L1-like esterase
MKFTKKDKAILCYGDSNTWGFVPGKANDTTMYKERYSRNQRWPALLQKSLGNEYYVIEEGLNGRTTNLDYEYPPDRNGKTYLSPCLYSHAPLDLVILALGGNDLKKCFHRSPEEITSGLSELIDLILNSSYGPNMQNSPQVLVLSQPIPFIVKADINADTLITPEIIQKARDMVSLFSDLSKLKGCYYLDIASEVKPSKLDGVHLDEQGHLKTALLTSKKIKDIYSNNNTR